MVPVKLPLKLAVVPTRAPDNVSVTIVRPDKLAPPAERKPENCAVAAVRLFVAITVVKLGVATTFTVTLAVVPDVVILVPAAILVLLVVIPPQVTLPLSLRLPLAST